jgi:eukaryotic-like serine/threonine-protein kinase
VPTNREEHFNGKEVGGCLLEYLLGYGGSSAVFLAQSLSSGEKVAVKIFLPRSTMDVEAQKIFYRRFLREAEAASQLDHPHILSIYSYGQHEGLPYIVMPYMPGGTLSDYVAHDGPLSLSAAQQYLEQIASALDYAHTNGCVHCDVKPANILLDGEGQALLTDFGIVRLKADDALPLKSGEALMGTPDFLSPEQALGKALDSRSDIYSLAVTLFFLLAGSPPFRADSALALALLHVHEPPQLLGTIRADVTPQIDLVIGKALSKRPEQRYQTAGEFSDAFAEAVANTIDQIAYSNHCTQGDPLGKGGKAAPPLEPAVRIKAVWERPFKFSQVAIALIFLLLILAASVSAAIIRSSTAKAPSPAHVQPTSTVQKTYNLFDDEDGWLPSSNDSSYFFDKLGRYHIQNTSSQTMAVTWYTSDQFTNFHLQVTASEVASTQADFYGIVLRAADQSYFYLFDVSALYGGQFAFWRCNKQCQSLPDDSVSAPSTTIGQSNTLLSVEATGNTFTFFINGYPVGKYTDSSTRAFAHVEVGLCVEEKDSEVTFSRLQIDKL